eukprot:350318-Chlamydomonas_euryale.AAC.15
MEKRHEALAHKPNPQSSDRWQGAVGLGRHISFLLQRREWKSHFTRDWVSRCACRAYCAGRAYCSCCACSACHVCCVCRACHASCACRTC